MDAIHEYILVIPAEAIDANRHANNVEYVRWMQEAAIYTPMGQGTTAHARREGVVGRA